MMKSKRMKPGKKAPMPVKEYEEAKVKLEKLYKAALNQLAGVYVKENNTVKVGDIFTDHIGSIKVLSIGWGYSLNGTPECVYTGHPILKSGKLSTKDKNRKAYSTNKI